MGSSWAPGPVPEAPPGHRGRRALVRPWPPAVGGQARHPTSPWFRRGLDWAGAWERGAAPPRAKPGGRGGEGWCQRQPVLPGAGKGFGSEVPLGTPGLAQSTWSPQAAGDKTPSNARMGVRQSPCREAAGPGELGNPGNLGLVGGPVGPSTAAPAGGRAPRAPQPASGQGVRASDGTRAQDPGVSAVWAPPGPRVQGCVGPPDECGPAGLGVPGGPSLALT